MLIGHRIGAYEVLAKLGEGGMGEVYRARDTRLDRDVALKILPESFAGNPDRLMRFTREAKTLASLNHPNIAAIYGIEERAIVMELIEGEDLSSRIARGRLPLDEALAIARQVVDAVETAHDAGIVHRDLKPANIKLRADGTVKVLDFGLAKAVEYAGSGSGVDSAGSGGAPALQAHGPTVTSPAMTALGQVLGTAAYMAPEQARGRPVDRRADIWAFGVLLYEMLAGRSCFAGESVGDVMAAVIKDAPDFDVLPDDLPQPLLRLLRRCLEKDPRKRLSAIGDARWDLEEAADPVASIRPEPHPTRTWAPWAIAALAGAVAVWAVSTPPAAMLPAAEGLLSIALPAESSLVTDDTPQNTYGPLVVSPDGRHVVYVAPAGRRTQLFVRAMTELAPRALPGTEGARLPFFSPDGLWVGFFADDRLRKIPLAGGTPVTLAEAPDGSGGSWGPNGEIVFAPAASSGLFAVPDGGGTPRRVTSLDPVRGDDVHRWPQVLPGGRSVLFTVDAWSRETSEMAIADLTTGGVRIVQQDASLARYVPGASGGAGQLVFVQDGDLMAASFDPRSDEPAGPPVVVLEGVRAGQFDVSASGTMVYVPAPAVATDYSLVWVDRQGKETPINDLPRGYEDLHLSPDGRRVAVTVEERGPDQPAHVWLADTARGTVTRFTFDGFSRDPVWAPDGQSIVFGSKRGDGIFGLYVQPLDGRTPAELVWPSPIPIWPDPQSWTPDGRTVVFSTKGAETSDDIWTLSLDDRTAHPWLATPAAEWGGRLSPDGRWMAYNVTESGRTSVYVQPFPGPGAKQLVSVRGGINPIWSPTGRELFYREDDAVLAVDVDTSAGFTAGRPVVLFSGRYRLSGRDFDVSPDGTRFVMMRTDAPRTTETLHVLLNWWRAFEGRVTGPAK
jgi:eukaryotic-like serine/threonine-protein kinase